MDDDGKAASVAAQRPAAPPKARSEAEQEIREFIETLDAADRKQFVADFKTHFGSGLAGLALNKHDEALDWAQMWQPEADFDA